MIQPSRGYFNQHAEQQSLVPSINLEFAQALLKGLRAPEKFIPCRYLYDRRGSELFERITELQEYYPTRTEASILRAFAPEFVRQLDSQVVLIEFGSGSSRKTETVLAALGARASAYVAIEISQRALDEALSRIQRNFPNLSTHGICDDFNRGLSLPNSFRDLTRVGFFPGSTIGNLERADSIELLAKMRTALGDGSHLIVGTDLVKSPDVLIPAYDDSLGVTAAFTRNILQHANNAVGTNFRINDFRHQVVWNERKQCVEIYLVCLREQTVYVLDHPIRFKRFERIHIEDSHKYTVEGFCALAKHAGWQCSNSWTDEQNWFAVHHLIAG